MLFFCRDHNRYYHGKGIITGHLGLVAATMQDTGYKYHVVITRIASDYTKILDKLQTAGRFVLATNILDKNVMSDEDILTQYRLRKALAVHNEELPNQKGANPHKHRL